MDHISRITLRIITLRIITWRLVTLRLVTLRLVTVASTLLIVGCGRAAPPRITPDSRVPVVSSTSDALYLDNQRLLDLDSGEIRSADKRGQLVPPLYDSLLERAEHLKVVEEGGGPSFGGDIAFALDPNTSQGTVRALLFTAGQAQFGEFQIAASPDPVLKLAMPGKIGPPERRP